MNLLKRIYITFKLTKEVETMATVYATLIIKGYKTFAQVPATIKEQVREVLIQLDAEHLIID